ncbi:hypothetical protein [Acetobacterium sp.]|uniref:hypothetical protein n=1 Tax=Acetobacterium sp. TaxID=1872094 RepID=UPI0035942F1A
MLDLEKQIPGLKKFSRMSKSDSVKNLNKKKKDPRKNSKVKCLLLEKSEKRIFGKLKGVSPKGMISEVES